ncbi:MAG: M61 family metallopeptidase [Gemmatimonadales bacterium]
MFSLGIVALVLVAGAQQQQEVGYEISFPNAAHHEAQVSATFHDVAPGPLETRMSRSSPGRYALHEFAKNVYGFQASDGAGRRLEVTRPNPHQWNVTGHDGTVRVTYTLFADRADGTYSGIDRTHAHLNMPATFLWARGMDDRPITVKFDIPDGSQWKIATQLVPTDDPYSFAAPDLQYFMDSPTELSDFTLRTWEVESNGHKYAIRMAVHHNGSDRDVKEFVGMTKKIVRQEAAVFGEFPSYDHGTYTFIADYLPYVFGDGMEHRNSTILSSRGSLRENARGLLGTVSHEYFHSWNMERIRAKQIEPFDFERANMSDGLWFGEGFTSYYTSLLIRRAGLMSDVDYARSISRGLNTVINSPARKFFGPAEMSMQAPFVDAATSNDPTNRANTFISYYTWGSVLGLGLDLTLRGQFGTTLDNYMRAMWQQYGKPGEPYTLDDLQRVLGEVSGDAAFAKQFFDQYVHGSDVLSYKPLLARAGFLLRPVNPGKPVLGYARLRDGDRGVTIGSGTIIGSPLYAAGLERGDRILALDRSDVRSVKDIARVLSDHEPGDSVDIAFESRSGRMRATLVLQQDNRLEVVPYEAAGLDFTDDMRQFRRRWLDGR